MIDVWCSERHYFDHLLPVWEALEERGTFHVSRRIAPYAQRHTDVLIGRPRPRGAPILVASLQDSLAVWGRPRIYLEHGAGQTYGGDPKAAEHGSYSGGKGHGGTILFLCPNETVASRWRHTYPDVPVEVVGCPKLDRWCNKRGGIFTSDVVVPDRSSIGHLGGSGFGSSDEGGKSAVLDDGAILDTHRRAPVARRPHKPEVAGSIPAGATGRAKGNPGGPSTPRGPATIAVSFHADIGLCPETRWAFPHYAPVLADLAKAFRVIGHGHPRVWSRVKSFYESVGIEPVEHFDEVMERADLYAIDNSSTAFEFAATDRPVVLLNAPWYRRDVEHGLRFWSHVPGIQCDEPDDLIDTINVALRDDDDLRAIRHRAVSHAYTALDGHSASCSADAIRRVVSNLSKETLWTEAHTIRTRRAKL